MFFFSFVNHRFLIIYVKELITSNIPSSLIKKYKFRVVHNMGENVKVIWRNGIYVGVILDNIRF